MTEFCSENFTNTNIYINFKNSNTFQALSNYLKIAQLKKTQPGGSVSKMLAALAEWLNDQCVMSQEGLGMPGRYLF